jgi:hypothetical protein
MKLAKEKPELREHLVRAVKKAYFDPSTISEIKKKGPLVRDKEDSYLEDEFSQQETEELRRRYDKGDLSNGKGVNDPMKFANEKQLRKATIKLAWENEELRPHLIPLLKEAQEDEEEEDKEGAMIHHIINNTAWNKGKKKKAEDEEEEGEDKEAITIHQMNKNRKKKNQGGGRRAAKSKLPPAFLENIKKKKDEAKDKDEDEKEEKKASNLFKATVKLAYENKALRPHLIPLLKEAKEKYPWDECIKDQMEQYGDKETAENVCGDIKAKSQGLKRHTK